MIEFGSGTVYISNLEGVTSPLGRINGAEIETTPTVEDEHAYIPNIGEYEATIEGICKLYKNALMHLTGVSQLAIDMCPNRKVVHLAKHAKKRRARKKNLNRAIYILEKEII